MRDRMTGTNGLSGITRLRLLLAGVAVVGGVIACSGPSATPASQAQADTRPRAAEPSQAGMSEANILALLEAANEADRHGGRVAQREASEPQVKNFARRIEVEHEMLLQKGRDVSAKMNVMPQLGFEGQRVLREHSDEMAALQARSGKQFDQAYLVQTAAMHEKLLRRLEQASFQVGHPELRRLLDATRAALQEHIRLARAMARRLLDRDQERTS